MQTPIPSKSRPATVHADDLGAIMAGPADWDPRMLDALPQFFWTTGPDGVVD